LPHLFEGDTARDGVKIPGESRAVA